MIYGFLKSTNWLFLVLLIFLSGCSSQIAEKKRASPIPNSTDTGKTGITVTPHPDKQQEVKPAGPFDDYGKFCTDFLQCKGHCITDDLKCLGNCTGKCSEYTPKCGSYDVLINGHVGGRSIICHF